MKSFAVVLVLSLASSNHAASNRFGCVKNYSSSTDYFPDKVTSTDSEQWDIQYYKSYKVLTNKIANETYLLYQCGTNPPSSEAGKHAVVASVPLQDGVALTSTVQIPFLELMGLRSEIKSYIGDPQYISSSCLNRLISNGQVTVEESTAAANVTNWTKTNPDRIVLDGTFGGLPQNAVVGDQTILISEYEEASNKAIFEWLKVYAALFNREAEANKIVNETAARYDCVSSNAQNMAQTDKTIPQAIWAYYSNYPGYEGWNLATCDPVFNYYCEYARDCHVDLLTSNDVMSHANFSDFAKDADVFFYMSSDWDDVYANNSEWLDEFKSVKTQQVYDYQMSGPNSWFEQRLAEYDVVLEDFCTVANQTTNIFQHQRKWFRNILKGEQIGSEAKCSNVTAPLQTDATACFLADTTSSSGEIFRRTPTPTPAPLALAPAPVADTTTKTTASGAPNNKGMQVATIIVVGLIGIFVY